MNLFCRFLWLLIVSRFRPRVDVLGSCTTPFRCLPTDLDLLGHMNNGKYLSILDLARVDLMMRSGVAPQLAARGWYPVVASETIRFRRSLKLLQSFTVQTVVLGWDDQAFVLHQRFQSGETVVADAVVRARFLKKTGGSATPTEILAMAGVHTASPSLPDWVAQWNASQRA